MNNVLSSVHRHRNFLYLLGRPPFLRRFTAQSDASTVIKPDSEESVAGEFLKHLREVPQHDWSSCEPLNSLLVSSSPRVLSQITRRLDSYSLAVSFFEYLNEKSQSLKHRDESLSVSFQSVIEFACKEADSGDKLLQLYENAKEKKIPLTYNAAKFFISWFGRLGMVNQSVIVYEEIDQELKNTHVRNFFIDVLLKGGIVDDALKVLDEMLERESVFPPNESTVDIVFHGWLSKGHSERRRLTEEEIIQLVLKFGDLGLSPNCVWLSRFITTLCKNGKTNVAWETLSKLMKTKAPLKTAPFNALLTSLGRNMDIGRMNVVAAEMDEMGIQANAVTLGILINTLCKSLRVDEALEIFEQLRGRQSDDGNAIKADEIHFNTLINSLCNVGRLKEAEELLVKMKMEKDCVPNTRTYNCLVDGYCKAGQLDTAKSVVSRMKEEGIEPDVVTLNTMIKGMCRHRGVSSAVSFLMDMEKEGLKRNVVTYMTLINAYCNVSNIDKAMHWYDQMVEAGCSPDAKIYYGLISGLCQARRDHDALTMVEKLKRAGFSLDLVAYNMLIGLFCNKNKADEVYEMLTDMEGAGMKPDSVTCNILISYFSKQKDFESVHRMMEKMREDGFFPNVVTYGAIIQAYCSSGKMNEALKLFNDMGSDSKVFPNTVVYNILINALCKLGDLKQALSLKEDMFKKRVRPNVETYNAFFKILKDNNQLETVLELMDEMVKHSCEPNHITMEVLMKILPEVGESTKLKKFMQRYSVASPTEKDVILS
ncbi:unnamed protein product [Arabis nemorensis]|uniref:Pentacotripeptide-repeat region of PRORP domain-containing protein n=1 Tax=Arabis nemorensis TaxID=586526 RepID=A0A565CJZ7_9BRAS|nr:unnamed protein product [Arabis nemorensis]